MELGHLISGQIIILSSLLATVALGESTKSAYSLLFLSNLSYIKVAGEKGSILLLFSLSSILVIFLDFFYSQAKLSGFKTLSRKLKKANSQQVKGLIIVFTSFISAYIFQSLTFRVSNLFGIALIALNLRTIMTFIGLSFLRTWLYVIFILCNVLIFTFTYIKNAEVYYSILMSQIKFSI